MSQIASSQKAYVESLGSIVGFCVEIWQQRITGILLDISLLLLVEYSSLQKLVCKES